MSVSQFVGLSFNKITQTVIVRRFCIKFSGTADIGTRQTDEDLDCNLDHRSLPLSDLSTRSSYIHLYSPYYGANKTTENTATKRKAHKDTYMNYRIKWKSGGKQS